MLTDIELKVATEIMENGCIVSARVREMLNSNNRIVLTKTNFPNIRHFLCSYMTAFREGMYRGGMAWVCVITAKDSISFREFIEGQPNAVGKW